MKVSVWKEMCNRTVKILMLTALFMSFMFAICNIKAEAEVDPGPYGTWPYSLIGEDGTCRNKDCKAKNSVYRVYFFESDVPGKESTEPIHCTKGGRYIAACRNKMNREKIITTGMTTQQALDNIWTYHEQDGAANQAYKSNFNAKAFNFALIGGSGDYCGEHGCDTIDAVGHYYQGYAKDSVIKVATCGHSGTIRTTCTLKNCGLYFDTTTSRLNHHFNSTYTTAPSNGLTEGVRFHQCTRGNEASNGKDASGKFYRKDYQYRVNLDFEDNQVTGTHDSWYNSGSSHTISVKAKPGYVVLGFIKNDSSSQEHTGDSFIINKMTQAHSWTVNVSTYYGITYYPGLTNLTYNAISQTDLIYNQPVTLYPSTQFLGSGYTLNFNTNESSYDTVNNICSTYSTPIPSITGNLDFLQWRFVSADPATIYTTANTFTGGQYIANGQFTSKANGVANLQAEYSSKTIDLSSYVPTRVGYTFLGWYDSAVGGNKLTSVTFSPSTGNIDKTVYAHWQPITYKVVYKGNGNWNTSQGDYEQTLTFDKLDTLLANKFTRIGGQDGSWSSYDIKDSYNFQGWARTQNSWSTEYTDGQSRTAFNLSTTQDSTVYLYAIWKKPINITFKLQGGTYKGKPDNIEIKSNIWNTQPDFNFLVNNSITTEIINKQNVQVNNLYAYGAGTIPYDENGINTDYQKTDTDTVEYRFLGWNTDPNAKKPLLQYDVYNKFHNNGIKICDSLTLYAIWEPVLKVQLTTERVLGDLDTALHKKDTATAIRDGNTELIIRPGEQAQYIGVSKGVESKLKALFDLTITNIYNNNGTWTDTLNKNPSISVEIDGVPISSKHGLNRNITVAKNETILRKFNIPRYLGTEDSEPSSVNKTIYDITFTFTNDNSYYWNTYKSKKETAKIKTKIGLLTSDGTTDTIIKLLRTKIKNSN